MKITTWTALGLVLITSCGPYQRAKKSQNWEVRYKAGMGYYEEKKYAKASVLLETVIYISKGSEEGEKAMWAYANALYFQKKYILSAFHFKEFAQIYANSQHHEEATFLQARALYLSTNPYNLDAYPTFEAISATQAFLDLYPASTRRDEAQTMINELQVKLEKKAFAQVKLYFRMDYYTATITSARSFEQDYPDSRYVDESRYMKILSYYRLARKSTPQKKKERYEKVVSLYQDLVDRVPQSAFLKPLEEPYLNSRNMLNTLSKEQP